MSEWAFIEEVIKWRNAHWRNQNRTCYYCGHILHKLAATLDHKIPKSRGGDHSFFNTVACCKYCNNKKGDQTEEEFFAALEKVN